MVKKLPLFLQFGQMGFDSGFFSPLGKSFESSGSKTKIVDILR